MRATRTSPPLFVLLLLLLALAPATAPGCAVAAASLTFTVNSTADAPDAHPGDGICADAAGQCTLRAAIQEADAQPAGSTITIRVPADTYVLTLGPLSVIHNAINIVGAGARTTVITSRGSWVVAVAHSAGAVLTQVALLGGHGGFVLGEGGGIYNAGALVLSKSAVISSSASFGGGIYDARSARVWLFESTISGNTASDGGGSDNVGVMTLIGSSLSRNRATSGAGIENAGLLMLAATTLHGNAAARSGGGILNDASGTVTSYGTMAVLSSTITNNTAFGGGLENDGLLTLSGSTLSGNSASTGGSLAPGGGIYNSGVMTLTTSTLSHNAAQSGGGINNLGTMALTNSTLSRNTAQDGGGLVNTGTTTLSYVTIASNSEGIDNVSTITLTGTIVANSTSGANCTGLVLPASQGYNLDSGTSCGFNKPTDRTNANPLLGPLANNGGPTQTMALQPGSPAIDHAGTRASGCPATDQRGLPRPDEASDNGVCDIGAYESQHVG